MYFNESHKPHGCVFDLFGNHNVSVANEIRDEWDIVDPVQAVTQFDGPYALGSRFEKNLPKRLLFIG
jgi:hypothetical protein